MTEDFYLFVLLVSGIVGLFFFIFLFLKLSSIDGHLRELVNQGQYRIDNRF
jgi:hypothetical protein